jgi:hypothetical protein
MFDTFTNFWNNFNTEQQNSISLIFIAASASSMIYTIVYLIVSYIEYKKPIFLLKISIDKNRREGVDSSEDFANMFTVLHSSHSSDILTFEIHHNPLFNGILVTANNKSKVELLANFLSSLEGIRVEIKIVDKDPLDFYNAISPYTSVFKSSKRYGNFKTISTKSIQSIQMMINELSPNEFASLVIAVRPVNLKQKLEIKIGYLRQKLSQVKNISPNQNIQNKIDNLVKKNQFQIYSVKSVLITRDKAESEKLVGSFNLISMENTIYPAKMKYNSNQLRFIFKNSVFSTPLYYLGLDKSTYMNTRELGCFIYF